MTFAKSNLNDYIKVKLTEYGRKIYISSFTSLGLPEPHIKIDEEGYTQFQMHDFINTFGKYIYMCCEMPCETTVQIQVDSVLKGKCAKAKEIIKELLDCLKQDTSDPQTNHYVCQYMDKAEQFLKEIG